MTTSRLSFTSSTGATFPLDGSDSIKVVDLAAGLFEMPTDLVIDQRVGDGGVLVNSRRAPRRLTLSLMIVDPDDVDVMTKWADLTRALSAGGKLVFSGANGLRELRSVVLESVTRSDWEAGLDDTMVVSLVALDPWWYGAEVTVTGTFGAPTAWDAAIPWDSSIPWNGGSSSSITNPGDVSSPVDVVISPGSGSGQVVTFSLGGSGGWQTDPLIPASYFTMSTVTGRRGPTYGSAFHFDTQAVVTDWTLITEGSQAFDLPAGFVNLVFGITGATGDEAWYVIYSPRYYTP